jgi:hypothetical protein
MHEEETRRGVLVSVTGGLEKEMSEGGEYQRDYTRVASANS